MWTVLILCKLPISFSTLKLKLKSYFPVRPFIYHWNFWVLILGCSSKFFPSHKDILGFLNIAINNFSMDFSIFFIHEKEWVYWIYVCNISHKLLRPSQFLENFLEILEWSTLQKQIRPLSPTPRSLPRKWLRHLQITLIMWRGGLAFEFIWGIVGCTSFLFPIH